MTDSTSLCVLDDCYDARIASLKHQFESAQTMLRQMGNLPELLTLLGASDGPKTGETGLGENDTKEESDRNQNDKTMKTAVQYGIEESNSLVNFASTSLVEAKRNVDSGDINVSIDTDGHFASTNSPVMRHIHSPTGVCLLRKSERKKSKHKQKPDLTISKYKKPKAESNTSLGVTANVIPRAEVKKPQKPDRQIKATVVDNCEDKFNTVAKDKTMRTAVQYGVGESNSLVNFSSTSLVYTKDNCWNAKEAKRSVDSGAIVSNVTPGHFAPTNSPVTSHSKRSSDSPTGVCLLRKSIRRNSKQRQKLNSSVSKCKKPKTESNTSLGVTANVIPRVEVKKPQKPDRYIKATIVNNYEDKFKTVAKDKKTTSFFSVPTSACNGNVLRSQLLPQFTPVFVGAQIPQFVYSPAVFGEARLPCGYIWTTPSWMPQYGINHSRTLNDTFTGIPFRYELYNHGQVRGSYAAYINGQFEGQHKS